MDTAKAKQMLETARDYVGDDLFVPMNFEDVDLRAFLRQYLLVIYGSSLRYATVRKHFSVLCVGFRDLDLDQIVAMDAIDARTLPISHQGKANAFLAGCRLIHRKGWRALKAELQEKKMAALRQLPWTGPATTKHMALALGIEDTAKPDTWMMQCAAKCSTTVDEMVAFLSTEYGLKRQQVDAYLWQYCRDHQRVPLAS